MFIVFRKTWSKGLRIPLVQKRCSMWKRQTLVGKCSTLIGKDFFSLLNFITVLGTLQDTRTLRVGRTIKLVVTSLFTDKTTLLLLIEAWERRSTLPSTDSQKIFILAQQQLAIFANLEWIEVVCYVLNRCEVYFAIDLFKGPWHHLLDSVRKLLWTSRLDVLQGKGRRNRHRFTKFSLQNESLMMTSFRFEFLG